MHITFTNIHIYNEIFYDGWFINGLILPLVLEGVSQLPISDNASNVDVDSNIEYNEKSDVDSNKYLTIPKCDWISFIFKIRK
jgi:hypothetical protein